ncbi:MAG: hypothetical protein PVI33_01500 [Candidatus Omnitrophota bacterium]
MELEIFNLRTLTILEKNQCNIDEWFFAHHMIIGPILFFVSLFDAYALNRLLLRL